MALRPCKSFITHKALLDQAFAHCPKFHSADLRKDPGFISVPAWLHVLTNQLSVIGLVGPYPANYHDTVPAYPQAIKSFNIPYSRIIIQLLGTHGLVPRYYSRIRHDTLKYLMAIRLAWVKHALSIHSEPG